MVKILTYKKINNNKYLVKFDNGKELTLYEELLVSKDLFTKNLIEDEIEELKALNNNLLAYYTALNLIRKKIKSEKEIRDILHKKMFSSEQTNFAVNKLIKNKLIDDSIYANSYITHSLSFKKFGPQKILKNLNQKGIDKQIIQNQLENIDNDVILNNLISIINKRYASTEYSKQLFFAKNFQYLLSLGYEASMISNIFADFYFDNREIFRRTAQKYLVRYSSKEKFFKKMLSLGYDKEDVIEFYENNFMQ